MSSNPKTKIERTTDRRAEMQELTDKLQEGISAIRSSQGWKDMLKTMSRFHAYSINNQILISLQRPDASIVGSYTTWKALGRQVNKGEHGIKIFCPAPYRKTVIENKKDPDGHTVIGTDGKPVTEKKQVTVPAYRIGYTYDVSQTSGKELPHIGIDELQGSVEGYETFKNTLESLSSVPVRYENITTGAKGYCSPHEIVINQGMSEMQTIKTLIHEETHSRLHLGPDKLKEDLTPSAREVQAESVAYVICQHYGIDTSDYSFAYVAGWDSVDDRELKASMEIIRQTASKMIDDIDDKLSRQQKHKIPDSKPIDQDPQYSERSLLHR